MSASWYDRGYSVGQRWRWTLLLATAAFFIGALSTFYWHNEVFGFLLAPAEAKLSPFDGKPIVTAPTAMFGATLGLAVFGGKLAAFPIIFVGALSLLKPLSPYNWWRRFIAINAVVGLALFTLGDIFVYYVMMPVSMRFLLSFGADIVEPVITLNAYMDLLFALFRWIGIVFMLPLFMNMLARIGWLSYGRAKGFYRVGFLLTAFFSALISPGLDPTLTIMVAVPMYALYLIGLGTVWATDTDAGNYLWLKSADRQCRKLWRGWLWLWRRPDAAADWLIQKVSELIDRFRNR